MGVGFEAGPALNRVGRSFSHQTWPDFCVKAPGNQLGVSLFRGDRIANLTLPTDRRAVCFGVWGQWLQQSTATTRSRPTSVRAHPKICTGHVLYVYKFAISVKPANLSLPAESRVVCFGFEVRGFKYVAPKLSTFGVKTNLEIDSKLDLPSRFKGLTLPTERGTVWSGVGVWVGNVGFCERRTVSARPDEFERQPYTTPSTLHPARCPQSSTLHTTHYTRVPSGWGLGFGV